MSFESNLSGNAISTPSNKKQTKSNKEELQKSSSVFENVQIRLSDLGIIKQSPSMEELSINKNRILSILDETIEKLQIAANLKELLQNRGCKLRKCLLSEQVEYIETVCCKYTKNIQLPAVSKHNSFLKSISTMIENISRNQPTKPVPSEDSSYFQKDTEDLLDPHIIKVMEMIWNNRNLKKKVLTEWNLVQDPLLTSLIDAMKNLRDAMKYRLAMTAFQEKQREKSLRHAWNNNALVLTKLEKVNQELEDQRQTLQSELDAKRAQVEKYNHSIENTKERFKNKIKTRVYKSESAMHEDTQICHEGQEDLIEASKNATTAFENLVTQHMVQERNLRKIRSKVETQLSSWLTKFDNDVGERQTTFENLTDGYEEEKAVYESLLAKFNEQEEEYNVFMAEKYEEEERIWEERAIEYLRIRSARRIQRCWRAYKARKLARKKAKKGKKDSSEKIKTPKRADEGKDKKGKGKGKKDKKEPVEVKKPDFNAALLADKKFGGDVFDDLQGPGFGKEDVIIEL